MWNDTIINLVSSRKQEWTSLQLERCKPMWNFTSYWSEIPYGFTTSREKSYTRVYNFSRFSLSREI